MTMRFAMFCAIFCLVGECLGADNTVKATRVLEGHKTTFPKKSLSTGVKVVLAALDSCHDVSDGTIKYSVDDLKEIRKKDYVQFVFTKPIRVKVQDKKFDATEIVFADGVFWLRCGKDLVRCTKYKFDKFDLFQKWYRQTLPAD